MTTNGNGKPRFKPASLANLKAARDAWKADATYPDIVDGFTTEMIYEGADTEPWLLAMDLADQVDGLSLIDALEVLAKAGMVIAEKEEV